MQIDLDRSDSGGSRSAGRRDPLLDFHRCDAGVPDYLDRIPAVEHRAVGADEGVQEPPIPSAVYSEVRRLAAPLHDITSAENGLFAKMAMPVGHLHSAVTPAKHEVLLDALRRASQVLRKYIRRMMR